jgi:hypothetical protein
MLRYYFQSPLVLQVCVIGVLMELSVTQNQSLHLRYYKKQYHYVYFHYFNDSQCLSLHSLVSEINSPNFDATARIINLSLPSNEF